MLNSIKERDRLIDTVNPRAALPRGFGLWTLGMQITWLKQNQKKRKGGRLNMATSIERAAMAVRSDIDRRNNAAKAAIKIVQKFPQIEQQVLAPMLRFEIGKALLDKQRETARNCAAIVLETRTIPRKDRKYHADANDVPGLLDRAYRESAYRIGCEYGFDGSSPACDESSDESLSKGSQ